MGNEVVKPKIENAEQKIITSQVRWLSAFVMTAENWIQNVRTIDVQLFSKHTLPEERKVFERGLRQSLENIDAIATSPSATSGKLMLVGLSSFSVALLNWVFDFGIPLSLTAGVGVASTGVGLAPLTIPSFKRNLERIEDLRALHEKLERHIRQETSSTINH